MGLLESMTEGIISQLESISERLEKLEQRGEYNTDIKMLRVEEVSEAISLSEPKIYGMIREKKIPYIEVGRRKLIPRRYLIEWMNKQIKSPLAGTSGEDSINY